MKKLLGILLGLVLAFTFVPTVSAAGPTDLVGWWRFENNTLDETSNNNDGALQNGATYDASGKIGSALKLDGTNDYVSVPFSTSLDFTAVGQDFSAQAWVYAESGGAIDVIYSQEDGSGTGRYWLRIESDNRVASNMGGTVTQTAAGVITRNDWNHVALTFDKGAGQTGTLKIYVGKIEKASSTRTLEASIGDYRIGVGKDGGNPFKGKIDEVSLWKKALSDTELDDYDFDKDDDGVLDEVDKCLGTGPDPWDTESLGVNRLMWEGVKWQTKSPKGKIITDASVNMPYTYGCSCTQILGEMVEETQLDFGGHYKYGCSKSILEDWNEGKYYIGPTLIDTVNVPANSSVGVLSSAVLEAGKDYFLKAYGMACAEENTPGTCTIFFDAEYSYTPSIDLSWVDGVTGYGSYGTDLLDLKVDGSFIDWGAYNSEHTYQIPYAGTGSPIFLVNDAYYPNNSGSLSVDIIEDKWEDLW